MRWREYVKDKNEIYNLEEILVGKPVDKNTN
jgi:hypothetical protein